MRKRDRQLFVRRCHDLIARLGGIRTDGFYQWELPTRYGQLGLSVTENTTSGPGTVFTRFDDPKAAHPHTNCNPYSGKWNHHYFGDWTVDDALAEFECRLQSVLPADCRASADEVAALPQAP
jgi:hypothetical protein